MILQAIFRFNHPWLQHNKEGWVHGERRGQEILINVHTRHPDMGPTWDPLGPDFFI